MKGKLARDLAKKAGIKSTKRHKYGAVKTTVDGIAFSSKKEAKRYGELKLLRDNGEIGPITLQPYWNLIVNGIIVGKYVADFFYISEGRQVVEDVKGFRTPLYRWKKKHFEAQYGIKITEI